MQGAEAKIDFFTLDSLPTVVKQRLAKAYRHPELEARITPKRVRQEVKLLEKALKGNIKVPKVYKVEQNTIYMEEIKGRTLKEALNEPSITEESLKSYAHSLGHMIAELHNLNIIHGDLTTSNFMVDSGLNLHAIDFGIGYVSESIEDRAVDLYVMERAFSSTHPKLEPVLESVLEEYKQHNRKGDAVMKRLEDVRLRGRKRDMTG